MASAKKAKVGSVIVDAQGRTLYRFTAEAQGLPVCTGACVSTWPPALVAAASGLPEHVATVKRPDDGRLQLTYDGHPLYRYAGDRSKADANGEGVGGQWFVVKACGAGSMNRWLLATLYRVNAMNQAWMPLVRTRSATRRALTQSAARARDAGTAQAAVAAPRARRTRTPRLAYPGGRCCDATGHRARRCGALEPPGSTRIAAPSSSSTLTPAAAPRRLEAMPSEASMRLMLAGAPCTWRAATLSFDPTRAPDRVLVDGGVDFVVIGGVAVVLQAHARDHEGSRHLLRDRSRHNLERSRAPCWSA